MKINLTITGSGFDSQAAYSALRFAQAAVQAGHSIEQVFFYRSGVGVGNKLAIPLADEFDATTSWAAMAELYSIPLFVCVSAAERRGVLDQDQSNEHDRPVSNLHSSYSIAGLGVMHQACLDSDRTVSFK